MKDTEAAEIITLVKAATNTTRLEENTISFWEAMLLPLDAAAASKTAIVGLRDWTRFPSWADFKQAYNARAHLPQGTNRSVAATDCATCSGDRFVLYALRPVENTDWMTRHGITHAPGAKIEELAPCPDCNPHVDADWFHFDGSKHRTPDPAAVRERLGS